MASAAPGAAYRHLRNIFAYGSTLGLEDGALLARYSRSNDPAAFEALVTRHGPMVLATCRAVLGNEHDAEDAFQATFLVLARKAHSVRGGEALGGWLHRVARRASVQASIVARRRRQKEVESARVGRGSSRPVTDLVALLHEEIDRLPESLRLPVVLCDLEALTYQQAADQLGWTLPRLRHRLADGRERLKARLTWRGALPLAIGAALASKASAVVPEALARSAVASAIGGSPPAGVVLLIPIILRGMLMTRIKLVSTASLAAIALGLAGVFAVEAFDDPQPVPQPNPQAITPKDAPAADLIDVRGVVVGPDGKPVAGASVYAVMPAPFPETTSGPDGRFLLRVPHPEPAFRKLLKQHPQVIASAPGFGLNGAAPPYPADPAFELMIKLVQDGPAIEGRVLDLEGRPVAGAKVNPSVVYFAEGGSLDPWIARVKDKQAKGLEGLWGIVMRKGQVETDLDGRFNLTGLGRERVASLYVTGPTIANSEVAVVLRDGPGFQGLDKDYSSMSPSTVIYHSPRFDVALAPGKPIAGTVRDLDTGKPIEGLDILARIFDPFSQVNGPVVSARTDAEGRYKVFGLVKAPAYRLEIQVPGGVASPYLGEHRKADAGSPGLQPVVFDFTLKRGVEVRGRVIDKTTGRPIPGTVSAYAFQDNPNLGNYPGYAEGRGSGFSKTDEDGRYRLVTIPGRAVIAFRADRDTYRNSVGAEAIAGYDPKWGGFLTTLPHSLSPINYHALVGADVKAGGDSTTVDLQVEPGGSLELAIVDPEGQPIGGLRVQGTSPQMGNSTIPVASSTVSLIGLDPEKPRRVTVFHDDRKLIGSIWIKGDEPVRPKVKLGPWGSVIGRVLSTEGKPRQPRVVYAGNNRSGTKPEDVGILPGSTSNEIKVGKDGRFRIDGLVPGLKYAGSASDGEVIIGDIFKNVTIAPGEVKDLGDLKVTPYRP